jgi:opacity protein-like surface antigen
MGWIVTWKFTTISFVLVVILLSMTQRSAVADDGSTKAELMEIIRSLQARIERLEQQQTPKVTRAKTLAAVTPVQRANIQAAVAYAKAYQSASPTMGNRWSGWYAGASVGTTSIHANNSGNLRADPGGDLVVGIGGPTTTSVSGQAQTRGLTAEIYAGFNFSLSSGIVAGLQVEGAFPRATATQRTQIGPCDHPACIMTLNQNIGTTSVGWTASGLARVGIRVMNTVFPYAIAGWSVASISVPVVTSVAQATHLGLVVETANMYVGAPTYGAGFEYALTERWNAKFEYRATHFKGTSANNLFVANCQGNFPCSASAHYSHNLQIRDFKVGLSHMLN